MKTCVKCGSSDIKWLDEESKIAPNIFAYLESRATELKKVIDKAEQEKREINAELLQTCISLVDGALCTVELFKTDSPAGTEWRKNWINGARQAIAEYRRMNE